MRTIIRIAIVFFAFVLLAATPAVAWDVTLDAIDSGNYSQAGNHSPNNTNYLAGDIAASGVSERRNFFVFDLSGVTVPVLAAALEIYNPSDPPDAGTGFNSPDSFETYAVWEVVTDITTLTAGGAGLAGIFDDLGGGIGFGSVDMTEADNGTLVLISLNHNGEAAINAATGGLWAVGGAVMTLDGNPLQTVFAYSDASMPRRLLLDLGGFIFADDFETGNTSAWSETSP